MLEKISPAKHLVKHVHCPACNGDSIYAESNPHRPFCSARCKSMDFGAWANEEFRLPADNPPDDEFLALQPREIDA